MQTIKDNKVYEYLINRVNKVLWQYKEGTIHSPGEVSEGYTKKSHLS